MKPSLIKLVDEILRKIEERPGAKPSESGLRTWLSRQGYAQRDIDAAIKVVAPRLASEVRLQEYSPGPVRLLSPFEEQRLTPEARNALARLEVYGLITPFEREMLLDRLGHFEGEVGLDELDYLLSWVVCSGRDVESQQTIFGVLEGEDSVFH